MSKFSSFLDDHYDSPWLKHVWWVYIRVYGVRHWLLDRLHPAHRHHVVHTGLAPGYHDPEQVLLYAAMTVLNRCVKEAGGFVGLKRDSLNFRDPTKWNEDKFLRVQRQADGLDEIAAIWHWWNEERPVDLVRYDVLSHRLYGGNNRIKWVSTDDSELSEMVFKPFVGEEIELEKEFRGLEKKINDDEQKMLHRLVDIRQSLWV